MKLKTLGSFSEHKIKFKITALISVRDEGNLKVTILMNYKDAVDNRYQYSFFVSFHNGKPEAAVDNEVVFLTDMLEP